MKKTGLWMLCAGACLLPAIGFAQDDTSTKTSGTSSREMGKSQQFCTSKQLVGADVKDSAGEKIGDIKEIYLNPQNGQTFASLDIGKGRHAVVPVQALKVTPSHSALRNAEVTINKTKADLESAPTVTNNQWSNLDDPSFTQRVYSHYNVQPPSAAGGTGASSGASIGAGDTSTTKPSEKQP